MRDPYCVGFWISSVISVSAIAIYFTGIWFNNDLEKAFAYINAVGTVLAGLAGLLVAGVTLYGLHLWKVQLYHGKYLSVIWDAQSTLRRVEIALMELNISALSLSKQTTDDELSIFMKKSDFGQALAAFYEKCQLLDRLVVRDRWSWVGYAADIEASAFRQLKNTLQLKFVSGFKDQVKRSLKSAAETSSFRRFVCELNLMLDKLESKYGV